MDICICMSVCMWERVFWWILCWPVIEMLFAWANIPCGASARFADYCQDKMQDLGIEWEQRCEFRNSHPSGLVLDSLWLHQSIPISILMRIIDALSKTLTDGRNKRYISIYSCLLAVMNNFFPVLNDVHTFRQKGVNIYAMKSFVRYCKDVIIRICIKILFKADLLLSRRSELIGESYNKY